MTLPTSNISILDMKNEATVGASSRITYVFTSTSTFTVPAGVTSVNISAIGGGGGGGGTQLSGDSHTGGGGGAGGVDLQTSVSVIPGEILQIQVGAGGTAASTIGVGTCVGNGTVNGGQGGVSRVYRAASPGISLALANGGYGGNGAVGDNDPPSDANHLNGSGNTGTPTVVSNPPLPWKARNSYYYTDGASNDTGFGIGGDSVGFVFDVRCPTPGTSGAVMISYTITGSGGSGGDALGDYYAGGALVPNPPPTSIYQTAPIPTSGPIEMGSFLGVTLVGIEDQIDQTLANSLSATGYVVSSRASSLGWNGVSPLRMKITVQTGVVLTNTTGGYAFTLGSLPSGSYIELINNGNIVGKGGNGGVGGSVSGNYLSPTSSNGGNGFAGGPAMSLSYAITITNNGLIGGGGGGGGGGAAAYDWFDDGLGNITAYGDGGGPGGGGAGGFGNPGSVGTANISGGLFNNNTNGRAGSSGTGAAPGFRGYNGSFDVNGLGLAGWGGIGGGFGQAGYSGTNAFSGTQVGTSGSGGNGGLSILGGANISWLKYGSVVGNIDNWSTWTGGGTNNSALMTSVTLAKETYMNAGWTMKLDDRWYWSVANSGQVGVPAATVTFSFIYANTTGSNVTAHLYGAVDNQMNSITINGVAGSVGTFPAGNAYTGQYSTGNFILVPGSNVIKVTLQNTALGVAGFNLRLRRTSDNAVLAGPLGWYF